MDDHLRVAQLAMMLSSDWPREPLDALYIHGLTHGMLEASDVLYFAAEMRQRGWASIIAFNGSDGEAFNDTTPGSAWPGKDHYVSELVRLDVPSGHLVPTEPGLHTRGEVEALIALAKTRLWKRIGIITLPYHFPRAFCYLPRAFKMHAWRPDVFAFNPPSTDWYLTMVASQGQGVTTPEFAAYDDAAKLLAQIEKGWAASLDSVFEYLRSRTP